MFDNLQTALPLAHIPPYHSPTENARFARVWRALERSVGFIDLPLREDSLDSVRLPTHSAEPPLSSFAQPPRFPSLQRGRTGAGNVGNQDPEPFTVRLELSLWKEPTPLLLQ